MLEFAVW